MKTKLLKKLRKCARRKFIIEYRRFNARPYSVSVVKKNKDSTYNFILDSHRHLSVALEDLKIRRREYILKKLRKIAVVKLDL